MTATAGKGGMEKESGKNEKPKHICSAAEGTVLLPFDSDHDGEVTGKHLAMRFG